MATVEEQYRQMVATYAAAQLTFTQRVLDMLLRLWAPMLWWGRPDIVDAAAAQSAVYVDIATGQARRLARVFTVQQLTLMGVNPPTLPPVDDTYQRGGTPMIDVYKRPARQLEYRTRVQRDTQATPTIPAPREWAPVSDDEWASFTDRMTSIVETDMAVAARDETHTVLAATPAVIGYRRIVHPELSRTGPCGLCVVAADRVYSVSDLLALHDLCRCTVAPITKDNDPGYTLNTEDLNRIYQAAGSTYAEQLKRIRVTVTEHGELGPILTREGAPIRTVETVNRTSPRKKFTPYKRVRVRDHSDAWRDARAKSIDAIARLENARDTNQALLDMTGRDRPTSPDAYDQAIEWHRALIARAANHIR